MRRIGAVIIGRNEGARLRRCVASIRSPGATFVYVDSGSTDGSVEWARVRGAEVIELCTDRPFSAARARNEGFRRLLEEAPATCYVHFVDGDCETQPAWLTAAVAYLGANPTVACVCGHLRERFPEASLYNRLCQIEWSGRVGDIPACGGVFTARRACFAAVGGFNETFPAGEERELGMRVRQAGWRIVRIDEEMALHDAAMLHFGQWWRRQVRGGYGAAHVLQKCANAGQKLYAEQVRSVWIWTVAWTLGLLMAGVAGFILSGLAAGALLMVVASLSLPLQMLRIARQARRRGVDGPTALAYGFFTVVSKWAQLRGHLLYLRDCRRGRDARLIEHKSAVTQEPLPAKTT